MDISTFVEKWKQSAASERANKDSFLHDLCDLLGVPHPDPKTGDLDLDRYVFERDVVLVHGGEKHTIGFIDLYKQDCFVLEAKQGSEAESKKIGTARRGTPAWNAAMQEAFGQALTYTNTIEPPPPFLIVTDIGYCFDLYASFDGTRNYRKFPDALSSRLSLQTLTLADLEVLRTIFTDPRSLDPSKRAAKVTREIAAQIAKLAVALENAGHDPERIAKFLMRCLFTMFAEDVDLLPKGIFAEALEKKWFQHPESFVGGVEDLWKKMNEGGHIFGVAQRIWQFDGGLFADPTALPLTKDQLWILAYAAKQNWADVEPAIFGTLLERALDPKERHRLGAHFTPRAYVERLVRPTIEEPLRAEWDNVRAQVQALVVAEDPDKNIKAVAQARKIVNEFYDKLTRIRVLDPACGSGNFLYVALDVFKRIENEIIDLLDNLGEDRARVAFTRTLAGRMVTPEQFHGIEIKEWAKWITELVLWIGWLQWQTRTRGWKADPPEPILREYHNIEWRDAVLTFDEKVPMLDDNGEPVTRWNGETMKAHPVTGDPVPDESMRVPVWRYVNPRKAVWPEAHFVVGNPPYIGASRMREVLGDHYVDALRTSHESIPESADLVMFWWDQAAELVSGGNVQRAGLITTKAISQTLNSRVVAARMNGEPPISFAFAIPNHPWVDSAGGAQVRVAMTVTARGRLLGTLATVTSEQTNSSGEVDVDLSERTGRIMPSLSIGTDFSNITVLASNGGIAAEGVKPHGTGFVVSRDVASQLGLGRIPELRKRIRPYVNGRDLTSASRDAFIIDLHGLSEEDVRDRYPETYQWILERVKPEREQNREAYRRENWWLFGRKNTELRAALYGLRRYSATVKTSKHRFFVFLDGDVIPDSKLIVVAHDDAWVLGTLSSRLHIVWALASGVGARLGVGDDPTYVKSRSFDCFPFPDPNHAAKQRIRELGEELDGHRKRQQALHPDLTITGMYNVLERLRGGEQLTAKERNIHEDGLVSVLKQIHDDLDAAVFEAYGWPHDLSDEQILERLVALNAERADEERRGIISWLRPDFQNPAGVPAPTQTTMEIEVAAAATLPAPGAVIWPKDLPKQIAAVRDLVTSDGAPQKVWSVDLAAKAFKGARKREVESVLDSLAALGILISFETAEGKRWRAPV